MSDYSSLKATINANVKANNNHEITGSIMNSVLNAMVNSLGAGYQFMGVATPTNPGSAQTPDYKCFYLATTPGTYTYLGGLVVADGEVALLKYDSSWTKEVTGIASADKLNQLGQELSIQQYTIKKQKIDIVFYDGGWWSPDRLVPQAGYSYSEEYPISKGSTITVKSGGDVNAILIRYDGGGVSRVQQDGTLKEYSLVARDNGVFVLSYQNSLGFEYCEVEERDSVENALAILNANVFSTKETPLIDIIPKYISQDTEDIIFCNSDAQITSDNRFRRIDIFAYQQGIVEVCFIQMNGSVPNILGSFFVNVQKGDNSIQIDNSIDIPFFDGVCYVGISAEPGIFGYNNSVETNVYYIVKSTNTSLTTHFYASYKIATYHFDLNEELDKKNDVLLPKGQIDVSVSKITLKKGQRIKGAGVDKTLVKNNLSLSGTHAFIETIENNEICNLTIKGNTHYTPSSSDANYTTLDNIKNRTNYPANNWVGLYLVGGGVFIHNVNIYDFERGIEVYSSGYNYAPTKLVNVTTNWCIEGLWVRTDYIAVDNVYARHNKLGVRVTGGNDYFTNCHFDENLNGAYFGSAGNDSHGSVCGCSFNHNYIYGLAVDGISNGECFVGCQCWEHSLFVRNAAGFNWMCGECDCNIYFEGGTKGYFSQTGFKHDYWDIQEGIHHNYNGHTDYIVMKDNFFIGETGENDSILNN